MSEAEKIWEEIKDKPISMYALPNQKVSDHLEKLPVKGNILYVRLMSSAVVGTLEEAIGKEYEVEQSSQYTLIKRAAKPVVEDENPKPYVRRRRVRTS